MKNLENLNREELIAIDGGSIFGVLGEIVGHAVFAFTVCNYDKHPEVGGMGVPICA